MGESIRMVGARLVGAHHRLLLVVPVLSEIAVFSVIVTKPNSISRARRHFAARYQSKDIIEQKI